MRKIVLVNGKKRSGKDFFAGVLKKELSRLGYSSEILSFAGPLKAIMAKTLRISEEDLDECKNNPERYPVTLVVPAGGSQEEKREVRRNVREVLQYFGTDAMREWFGEDVWVKLLKERVDRTDADFVIVPDFRFLSEYVSDLAINVFSADVPAADPHRSETELDGFKFKWTVDNTGQPDLTEAAAGIAMDLSRLEKESE